MKDCGTTGCSKSQWLIGFVVVFVFMFAFDMLVYGKLLMPFYAETPQLWRTPEEMKKLMPLCFVFHFLLAIVITCMFAGYKNYSQAACDADPALAKKCSPCSRGICYGTHLGLIFGLGMFSSYIWLPVSLTLAGLWLATGLVKGVCIGVLLSCTAKNRGVK